MVVNTLQSNSMIVVTRFYTWAYQTVHRLLKNDFIRFCVVGSVGFLVNLVFLTLLHGIVKLHVTPAQLISAELALLSNFVLHNAWTFKNHQHTSTWNKLVRFHMSSWTGVVITTVVVSVGVEHFKLSTLVSLVIASAIAMFWNFFWTKFFIFKSQAPAAEVAAESVLHTKES